MNKNVIRISKVKDNLNNAIISFLKNIYDYGQCSIRFEGNSVVCADCLLKENGIFTFRLASTSMCEEYIETTNLNEVIPYFVILSIYAKVINVFCFSAYYDECIPLKRDIKTLNELYFRFRNLLMIEPYNIRNLLKLNNGEQSEFLRKRLLDYKIPFTKTPGNIYEAILKDIESFMSNLQTVIRSDSNLDLNVKKINTSELDNGDISYEIINERDFAVNPAVGREHEIRELGATLLTSSYSALLLGEPGVGKTAIVEGLAYAIKTGNISERLKDKVIIKISPSSIVSGTRYRGDFEKKFQVVIDFFRKNPNAILYMDELHTAYGAGCSNEDSNDILNILKPYLENGSNRLIGATTNAEYDEYLSKDQAFTRRLKEIKVNEPTPEMLKSILLSNIAKFESQSGITFFNNESIKEQVLDILIEFTNKNHICYDRKRYNPALSLSIIEAAFGYALYDSEAEVGIKYLTEAMNRCENIYSSVREKYVALLSSLRKSEPKLSRVIYISDYLK